MNMGWVDYSRQERETIKELIKMLGETTALDELGVGIIRDSISDLLYPGLSVLHTRAKYYVLIPALFHKALQGNLTTAGEVRRQIDGDQDEIARALRQVIDEQTQTKFKGIIGGRSDRPVKMKPVRIYWNALRTTGILRNPKLSYDDACHLVANYNKNHQNLSVKKAATGANRDDMLGGDAGYVAQQSLDLFTIPCCQGLDEFLQQATLYLTKEEAKYLYQGFLQAPIMKDTLLEYCLQQRKAYQGVSLADMLEILKKDSKVSQKLRDHLTLAVEFADFIYGAYVVYRLMYWDNGGPDADGEQLEYLQEEYADWRARMKQLPSEERLESLWKILALVPGRDHYKASVQQFLRQFNEAVSRNPSKTVCSPQEKKIIREREISCKKDKAKLGKKKYPYQLIHEAPMNYRHYIAQVIIDDIVKGLV